VKTQNFAHVPSKVGVVGASGTGKSTYFLRFLRASSYHHKFVFDAQGELWQRLGGGVVPCFTTRQLDEAIQRGGFVVFDPVELFEGDLPGAWDYFCDLVFRFAKLTPMTPKLIATDEFQDISSTDMVEWNLMRVVESGRRYTLDWSSVQQGLNLVHNRVRTQLTEVIAFRTTDARPLEPLLEMGFPESVSSLPDFSFVAYHKRSNTFREGKIAHPALKSINRPDDIDSENEIRNTDQGAGEMGPMDDQARVEQ